MIKYLGSKRRLVPLIGGLVSGVGATTALDLFTGSTRVARAMKASGVHVTAIDRTRAAHVLARCSIATDADEVDHERLARLVDELDALPGRAGYVTEVFCRQARYFRPENGERIDAVRSAIDDLDVDDPLRPVLLTSLLQVPELLAGPGRAVVGAALDLVGEIAPVAVAYLDPPYNQHRYESNYHVWETLVAGDEPDHYGVARKRVDLRDPSSRSPFNLRREMPTALESVVRRVRAEVVVVSVSDEAWVPVDEVVRWCRPRGEVAVIEVGSPRYVGARIGIHGRDGSRVGAVSHTRLREFLVVAGPPDRVAAALAGGAAELEALDGVVLGQDRSA